MDFRLGAKYTRSVLKCPTGIYIIVGSAIPEELTGTYQTRDAATEALRQYEMKVN